MTSKPRITITLTHRQHEILRSISDSRGCSMSGIVSDLITDAQPVLERMLAVSLCIEAQLRLNFEARQ